MWGMYEDDEILGDCIDMSYRTTDLIARIKAIKARNLISIDQNVELEALRKELDVIRKDCSHSFVPILLFVRHHSYCKHCDMEDYTYKRQD